MNMMDLSKKRTTSRHVAPTPGPAKSNAKLFYDLIRGSQRPTSWYDTKEITAETQQTLASRAIEGVFPSVAVMGSTGDVDVNDPVRLPHTGEHYVWFPGPAGNHASASVDLATTGATITTLVCRKRFQGSQTTQNLMQTVGATGTSRLYWATNTSAGNTSITLTKDSDGTSVLANTTGYVETDLSHKVEIEWDANGVGVPQVRLFGAVEVYPAAPTWVLRGTSNFVDVVRRTAGSATLTLGNASAASVHGGVAQAYIQNDSDTPRVEFNPSTQVLSQTAVGVWTVNRSATGLKTAVVTRPVLLLDGTDDYVQLPASDTPTFTATTGKHTVVVALRSFGNATNFNDLWSTRSSVSNGANIYWQSGSNSVTCRIGDSSSNIYHASNATLTEGEISVLAITFDTGLMGLYKNGVGFLGSARDYSSLGAITFATPRIGTAAYVVTTNKGLEVLACLTFKDQALTATQLDAIASQLLAGTY